jgi:hypothetical protein
MPPKPANSPVQIIIASAVAALISGFAVATVLPQLKGFRKASYQDCIAELKVDGKTIESNSKAELSGLAAPVGSASRPFVLEQGNKESITAKIMTDPNQRLALLGCMAAHNLTLPKLKIRTTVEVRDARSKQGVDGAQVYRKDDDSQQCPLPTQRGRCELMLDDISDQAVHIVARHPEFGPTDLKVEPAVLREGVTIDLARMHELALKVVECNKIGTHLRVELRGPRDFDFWTATCGDRGQHRRCESGETDGIGEIRFNSTSPFPNKVQVGVWRDTLRILDQEIDVSETGKVDVPIPCPTSGAAPKSAVPTCQEATIGRIRAVVGDAYLPVQVSIDKGGRATVMTNNPMAEAKLSAVTFPAGTACVTTVDR